jgi:hypothetical protein
VNQIEYETILLLAGVALAAHGSQKLFGSFGGSGPAGTRKVFAATTPKERQWTSV